MTDRDRLAQLFHPMHVGTKWTDDNTCSICLGRADEAIADGWVCTETDGFVNYMNRAGWVRFADASLEAAAEAMVQTNLKPWEYHLPSQRMALAQVMLAAAFGKDG